MSIPLQAEINFLKNDMNIQTPPIIDLLKNKLTHNLKLDFAKSKKITIKNGNSLVITAETPERKFFLDQLYQISRLQENSNAVHSYHQKEDGYVLRFSALVYLWNKVFHQLFIVDDNQSKRLKRYENRYIYDLITNRITNAKTVEELEFIKWNFIDSDGITINVNEIVSLIEASNETPQFVIDAINKARGSDGNLHLIQKI